MLQNAIESKDYILAKELLEKGEKLPNGLQSYRLNQIYRFLVSDNQFDLLNLLIDHGTIALDIYEYDTFDGTLFSNLIENLKPEEEALTFLANFLSKVDNLNDELKGKSFLSYALDKEAAPEIIKTLISGGCNAQIMDSSEHNLIHTVVKKYVRSYDKGLAFLQILWDEGIDIHAVNIEGNTPLHFAVKQQKPFYAQWLLDNGADPNSLNKKSISPFFLVVAELKNFEFYQMMRNYGTPVFDQASADGETMFCEFIQMMSVEYDIDFLRLLLEDGANIFTHTHHYGAKNAIDIAVNKPFEIMKEFIASGQLDVHWKDDQGNTALHKVCAIETLSEEKRGKEVYRIAKLLVSEGADPTVMNDQEQTPMMLALNDNTKAKTVELLLSHQ